MEIFEKILQKILIFEKEPQKIGLSQLREEEQPQKRKETSHKRKEVKLSDLMRRAS